MDQYDFNVDIWSAGCVFAELLNSSKTLQSVPLFPGGSCYPVSPTECTMASEEKFVGKIDEQDQIIKIMKVVGNQNMVSDNTF